MATTDLIEAITEKTDAKFGAKDGITSLAKTKNERC